MDKQKSFPWLYVILGIGCLGILCVGVLAVGGGAALLLTQRSEIAEPTTSQPNLTGNQYLDESSMFDDFSSQALGWSVFDDGKSIFKYENEAYAIQILEPDYWDWSSFPVDFIPYEVQFDVQPATGQQDGNYGVFCQYQDFDNYYYVEFYQVRGMYWIGQYVNGEKIILNSQRTGEDFPQYVEALNSSSDATNHVSIGCYQDIITLYINDQWVDEVDIQQPSKQLGKAGFFVWAHEEAGTTGYKVFFDNVEAWQPTQR